MSFKGSIYNLKLSVKILTKNSFSASGFTVSSCWWHSCGMWHVACEWSCTWGFMCDMAFMRRTTFWSVLAFLLRWLKVSLYSCRGFVGNSLASTSRNAISIGVIVLDHRHHGFWHLQWLWRLNSSTQACAASFIHWGISQVLLLEIFFTATFPSQSWVLNQDTKSC